MPGLGRTGRPGRGSARLRPRRSHHRWSAVQPNSLFRIASTTKPVTGMATMALVDDGLLALDDPVGDTPAGAGIAACVAPVDGPLDETVPAERPITLRDLLDLHVRFRLDGRMFTAPEPWPVVEAASRLHLSTFGPARPGGSARSGHVDGCARVPPSAGPAGRTVVVQHGRLGGLGVLLSVRDSVSPSRGSIGRGSSNPLA